MAYKAFEDFYKEESIKHLGLIEYNNSLVSPPFCTNLCKEYNDIKIFQDEKVKTITLDLPAATSKFNGMNIIDNDLWLVPYSLWDKFDTVIQLKNFTPLYHKIDNPGKGQFYSLSSSGTEGFSFPLGYENTNYALHIKENFIKTVKFNIDSHKKLHMGTVYCNGSFWSPPRGDTENYCNIMQFNNNTINYYPIKINNPGITRKYSDFLVNKNILYALPYGEYDDFNEILEFDTEINTYNLIPINIPNFNKKYNHGVILNKEVIIALPYGDEWQNNSNWGLYFNLNTKKYQVFDIEYNFGGKWRFRSGINFFEDAVFFPTGSPNIPIISIDISGKIKYKQHLPEFILGRPVLYQNKVFTIAYNISSKEHFLFSLDSNYRINMEKFL
jgi:hypothetical protein